MATKFCRVYYTELAATLTQKSSESPSLSRLGHAGATVYGRRYSKFIFLAHKPNIYCCICSNFYRQYLCRDSYYFWDSVDSLTSFDADIQIIFGTVYIIYNFGIFYLHVLGREWWWQLHPSTSRMMATDGNLWNF